MKVLALFVAAVGCLVSSALAEYTAPADLAKMKGTWNVSYYLEQGTRRDQPKTVSIEDGVLSMGGDKFKISLDTTKDPHEINLQDVDADYRVFRGIYEFAFDDDQLRISFAHWDHSADSPNARPKTLNSENADFFHLKLMQEP